MSLSDWLSLRNGGTRNDAPPQNTRKRALQSSQESLTSARDHQHELQGRNEDGSNSRTYEDDEPGDNWQNPNANADRAMISQPTPRHLQRLKSVLRAARQRLQEQDHEITKLSEARDASDSLVRGYRKVIEDKSKETSELKAAIEALKKELTSSRNCLPVGSSSHSRQRNDNPSEKELLAASEKREEKLKTRFKELKAAYAELRQGASELRQELQEMKNNDTFKGSKISDTEIQSQWKNLGFMIRQFVSKYLSEHHTESAVQALREPTLMEGFKSLSSTPELFLESPWLFPIMMESSIWNILYLHVFASQSRYWAGDIGREFYALWERIPELHLDYDNQRGRADLVAGYHDYRARSVDFLAKLDIPQWRDYRLGPLFPIKYLVNAVWPNIHTLGHDCSHSDSDIVAPGCGHCERERDIWDIVEAAADLDFSLRLSKASFRVFFTHVKPPPTQKNFGFPFDPETMDCREVIPGYNSVTTLGRRQIVDLIVSPGLLKAGNSDGNHYDEERVLVKLSAVCNVGKALELANRGQSGNTLFEGDEFDDIADAVELVGVNQESEVKEDD